MFLDDRVSSGLIAALVVCCMDTVRLCLIVESFGSLVGKGGAVLVLVSISFVPKSAEGGLCRWRVVESYIC